MSTRWFRALLPAVLIGGVLTVPASGADDPPTRAQLATSVNNLKQIVLAFHSFNDASNKLPGDVLGKNGKPLLSWRVAILPFVEETPLYREFKLDEPWDSDNNKKLIEKMPKLYAPVRVKAKAGETFYQIFKGEGTIYSAKYKDSVRGGNEVRHQPRYTIGNLPDGTSTTGLVFEAGEPVVWSKPEDMILEAKKPIPKLGGLFDGECHVGLCDGSVRRLKKDPDEKELRNLISPDDGNVVDFKKLFK